MSLPISSVIAAPSPVAEGANRSGNAAGGNRSELAKLQKASGEFESILLVTLWKSMKETFSDPDNPDDKDSDPTLANFDNLGMQAMAGAVGSAGGLGIKGLILKHLEPTLAVGGQGKAGHDG